MDSHDFLFLLNTNRGSRLARHYQLTNSYYLTILSNISNLRRYLDHQNAPPSLLPLVTSDPGQRTTTLTYGSVVENLGISTVRVFAAQLPDIKERLPVDVRHESRHVIVGQHSTTDERRRNSTHTQRHTNHLTTTALDTVSTRQSLGVNHAGDGDESPS